MFTRSDVGSEARIPLVVDKAVVIRYTFYASKSSLM